MNSETQYYRRFMMAMLIYAIVLIASILLLKQVASMPVRVLIAVLPIVPILFGLREAGRAIQQQDEFQRRIQLEALVFSLLGTCLLTFTYGLLQNAGLPQMDVIWVLPMGMFLWGIGQYVATRRYR